MILTIKLPLICAYGGASQYKSFWFISFGIFNDNNYSNRQFFICSYFVYWNRRNIYTYFLLCRILCTYPLHAVKLNQHMEEGKHINKICKFVYFQRTIFNLHNLREFLIFDVLLSCCTRDAAAPITRS